MHIINMTPLAHGVYNDHEADHILMPPDGWAYIPEGFPLPSTFPRLGSINAEVLPCTRLVQNADGEPEEREYTMLTVTSMTEGTLPEPEPEAEPDNGPTIEERVTTLEDSNAEMAEALDMILSGVTE